MIVEVRDATRPRIDAAAYCRWRAGVACVSTPTIAAHDPRQDCFMMEGDQGELRNFPHPISPALQARIDAITDADLRAHILFILADPEPRRSTDEQIVESMVLSHERAMELREERGLPSHIRASAGVVTRWVCLVGFRLSLPACERQAAGLDCERFA
jgi:hypothetical protein